MITDKPKSHGTCTYLETATSANIKTRCFIVLDENIWPQYALVSIQSSFKWTMS